ncbi:MAG: hypothetical protein HETSPECPRED_003832 [Heterodermia speciosa]|uniref:Uncharacterized protein n=1 Tax=Heterodermia speciosa TaxID=116794 RepID=A0A8H3IM40_9LECA|nr:MAG: hypothetical protein HETSPECPRED_003832 [Heterodermia speciosa]
MSPKEKTDPSQWTLRFKYHRTTIILLVAPTASFSTIKSSLLTSIRATGLTSIPPDPSPIPTSPDDVILGLPLDRNELDKGWIDLLIPEEDSTDTSGGQGAGKGKKEKGTGVRKGSVLNESPLGAGLRDGDVVAFRWRKERGEEGEWDVVIPSFDEEDEEYEAEEAARMEM